MARRRAWKVPVALCGVATVAWASGAAAQPTSDGKGIAGGVLLGAELVVFGEAIAGIETPWLYWAGAGLGAVGGGIGGYYVESAGSVRSSYYLLAGGMALSIPALVVYLDATNEARRAPPSTEGLGPDYDAEPLDELDEASLGPRPLRSRVNAPLDFDGTWSWHPPSVAFAPAHTEFEVSVFGAPRSTYIFVPVLSGVF